MNLAASYPSTSVGVRLQPRPSLTGCRFLRTGLQSRPPRLLLLSHGSRRAFRFNLSGRTQTKPALVGGFDAHEAIKGKFPNERKTGTPAGNLAARERNAC